MLEKRRMRHINEMRRMIEQKITTLNQNIELYKMESGDFGHPVKKIRRFTFDRPGTSAFKHVYDMRLPLPYNKQ